VAALLDAAPPLRLMLDLAVPPERQQKPRAQRTVRPGLPVCADPEVTRLAQIAFAGELKLRRRSAPPTPPIAM
jgi:hypothetical protein